MSKRLYPHKNVRYWYSYEIEEICNLFSKKGLHGQTVRTWVKKGLKTIDKGKPALIYGYDLIAYLKKNNLKQRCKTDFHNLFCMKCQDQRPIFQRKINIEQQAQFLKVKGHCQTCKTLMSQNYAIKDFPRLRDYFQLVDVLELYDTAKPCDKTHIDPLITTPLNESIQGELFI